MAIHYITIPPENSIVVRDLCNELMAYQKSKAHFHPEFFDKMNYETRLLPSLASAKANFILAAMDGDEPVGYAYSNIAPKTSYEGNVATLQCDAFFDFSTVDGDDVGCLSQFYLKDGYRNAGIGSELFRRSMEWMASFHEVKDLFIFVSNGNDDAFRFYERKGFRISHQILDGFITVMRNRQE